MRRKKVNSTRTSGADRGGLTDYGKRKCSSAFFVVLLCLCFMLCGCTRREQIKLETAAALQTKQEEAEPLIKLDAAARQAAGADDGSGRTQVQDGNGQTDIQSGVDQQTVIEQGRQTQEGTGSAESVQAGQVQKICVHVCGAVKKPGVYELPEYSRVYEAVEKAGGFSEDADQNYVNQAQCLSDGLKLVIPTVREIEAMASQESNIKEIGMIGPEDAKQCISGQPPASGTGGGSTASLSADAVREQDGRININTATKEELCAIPGIGSTRAAAIIAYRQETGGFTSVEDIMNVSGIKEGTYAKIKDNIKVN